MVFLGIDNGLDGGMVALSADGKILAKAVMPTYYKSGKSGARLVDERAMLKWLRNLKEEHGDIRATLEMYTHAKQFFIATSMADSFATTRTVLRLLGIPVLSVIAKEWQACFWKKPKNAKELGWTTKKQALRVVNNNWPDTNWLATNRSTTPHDGMVDACLIAEFRRRFYE